MRVYPVCNRFQAQGAFLGDWLKHGGISSLLEAIRLDWLQGNFAHSVYAFE
jgi:hypothetical protein